MARKPPRKDATPIRNRNLDRFILTNWWRKPRSTSTTTAINIMYGASALKEANSPNNAEATRPEKGRVERWRGGLGCGLLLCPGFPVVRCLNIRLPCSVSTSRSSNRTCGFPASGSRTRTHAFAHAARRAITQSGRAPIAVYRYASEKRASPRPASLCFRRTPLAEPLEDVGVHGSIGPADRAQREVIRPAREHAVDHGRRVLRSSHSHLTRWSPRESGEQPLDLLLATGGVRSRPGPSAVE